MQGSVGLVADGAQYTFMERVAPDDMPVWLSEKREGAGRDRRLAPLRDRPDSTPALFREAVATFETPTPALHSMFQGPSATAELSSEIAASGLEPQGFTDQFISGVGIAAKGAVAIELRVHLFTLWVMAVHDRLNLPRLVCAEHVARRSLQLMAASRRNPRAPDWAGLDAYLRHLGGPSAPLRTPAFDQFVTDAQKTEAFILKQSRLVREENAAENKRSKNNDPNPKAPGPSPKAKAKATADGG